MVGGDDCGLVQSGCSMADKCLDYGYILKVQPAGFAYILDGCWKRKKEMMTPRFCSEQPC